GVEGGASRGTIRASRGPCKRQARWRGETVENRASRDVSRRADSRYCKCCSICFDLAPIFGSEARPGGGGPNKALCSARMVSAIIGGRTCVHRSWRSLFRSSSGSAWLRRLQAHAPRRSRNWSKHYSRVETILRSTRRGSNRLARSSGTNQRRTP